MDKIYGDKCCADGIYRIGRNKWQLVYGEGKDNDADKSAYYWRHRFSHKPTAGECRALIKETIDRETERKLLNGATWCGKPVYLSIEQQLNYQHLEKVWGEGPREIKIGEDSAGNPVMHTFADKAEFGQFAAAIAKYIIDTIESGRKEKDSVDWTRYKIV